MHHIVSITLQQQRAVKGMCDLGRILMGCMQLLGPRISSCCMDPSGTSAELTGDLPMHQSAQGAFSAQECQSRGGYHFDAPLQIDIGSSLAPVVCRHGMKASVPYQDRRQPLVSST